MQSEQQQRIMGYFIEEAKDHLNTIEQGLLSLQSTMEDRELLNEIFRAAHSIKGGAAMLGINSIQQTAHRLEDCFKVLQESPVKADHQLESLFLKVFDTLQALVEQLQSPFGLTDEAASEIMSDAESVFEELKAHLEHLVKKAESGTVATVAAPKTTLANTPINPGKSIPLPANFKRDVLIELREMLQLFKQQDSPQNREALQKHCTNLARLGEQLDLPGWGELLETARAAIAFPTNSYRLLANVVIKEIKQAQELVVTGRSVEISVSEQLKALVPESPVSESATTSNALEPEIDLTFDQDVAAKADESFGAQDNSTLLQDDSESSLTNIFESPDPQDQAEFEEFTPENIAQNSANQSFLQSEKQKNRRIYRFAAPSEPEVGMAELNTLADIFEGQTPDLDETWQEEEVLALDHAEPVTNSANSFSFQDHKDFSDLVGDLNNSANKSVVSGSDDLMDLFEDEFLEKSVPLTHQSTNSFSSNVGLETPASTTDNLDDDFSDLLFEEDSPDPLLASSSTSDDLGSLFGDSFFAENRPIEEDFNAFDLDGETTFQLQQQNDDLFTMPVKDVFEEAPEVFDFPSGSDLQAIRTDNLTEDEDADFLNFTTQENEFLASEASSPELENLDGEELWLDSDSLAESEMDFGDLLEISAQPADASVQEQEWSDTPAINHPAIEVGLDDLALGESASDLDFEDHSDWMGDQPLMDNPAIDELGLDESVLGEPSSDLDFEDHADWTQSQVVGSSTAENPPTALSLENSFWDTSTNDISDTESFSDLSMEDFMNPEHSHVTDAWNWDEGSEIALEHSATFDFDPDFSQMVDANAMAASANESDGDDAAHAALDLSALEPLAVEGSVDDQPDMTLEHFRLAGWETPSEASEFDFELDGTSTNAFNLETQTSEDINNLFEDELLPSSEASQSAALESLEAFADLVEAPTAKPPVTKESEFIDFTAFAEPQSSTDFEDMSDFFDAAEAIETDVFDFDTSAGLEVDNTVKFNDLSIFDTDATTDSQEVASPSNTQEETFVDLLFESSATDSQQTADLSDDLFDTDESELFDWDTPESQNNAAATPTSAPLPTSDYDALFGDETLGETDTLDFSGFASGDVNWETDLNASDSPSSEWLFEVGEDATAEAQSLFFAEEEADSATLNNLEALAPEPAELDATSDWEESFSDDIFANNNSIDVSADNLLETDLEAFEQLSWANEPADDLLDLDWEGQDTLAEDNLELDTDSVDVSADNLFETDLEAFEQITSANEAADDLLDLDWEGQDTLAQENLDGFLTTDTDEVADTQNWDDLLNPLAELDGKSFDIAALSEASEVKSAEDETAALFNLDWETDQSNSLLEDAPVEAADSSQVFEFDDLEAMLGEGEALNLHPSPTLSATSDLENLDEFASIEAMLAEVTPAPAAVSPDLDLFQDLDALLEEEKLTAQQPPAPTKRTTSATLDDEFGDLESLLEQTEKAMGGGAPTTSPDQGRSRSLIRPRPTRVFEHTMRVPVKHLDSLSNLVGELVVNRNTLEQDQERLRQFLDNLSHQVLALSDVGARMQDLYERSLLESSLLASRQGYRSFGHLDTSSHHPSGVEYDPLEMDRFTGFHLLSQEMIELIVRVRESASDIEFLVDETDQVARMLRQITTQLQEGLTRARMVPFAQNADRLLRAVHEISRKLGKEAQLQVEGRETLIDKMILEHLYDPMTHLVNNALTHGVEMPEVRKKAGKPRVGKVTLRAFHQGNQTVIAISDDGAGIDPERVRAKAIEQKLISSSEAKKLTNIELYDFLFHPGFSTKDKADDFSGRGVGMDVVRTSLSECRGTIQIDSAVGKGTTFTIRLPLTLSICKSLCCLSDRASIAFPMDGVEDAFDLPVDRIQTNSDGHKCIHWRDGLLPFQSLSDLLTYKRQLGRNAVYGGKREDDMISIIVLRSAGNFLAIQVDKVIGEQEIVIKQLEGPPPKPVGIAGATVLGDGRIMAIADVLELIDLANGRIRKDGGVAIWPREEPQNEVSQEAAEVKHEPMVLIVDDSITVRELLSMTFNKSGYRVEQARDGQEAWEKLRSGLPCDIVFCDIEMPRMDGLELLSRLQKDEKLMHLPIAMLTSRGADRHRQMASQLGASGYFTKPYLEEVLLDAAQRMIRGEVLFSSNSNT